MEKEAKYFLTYDMLGDLKRSGPVQWKVDRARTEDVKDHTLDLIVMIKLIKPYLPSSIDVSKMIDYALFHDNEEVITGDITGFEGVSSEEKERVNKIAMNYLTNKYSNIMNIENSLEDYEEKKDIEAKIVYMLDKMSSCIPFLKYDYEQKVDMDNPKIIDSLRNNPGVVKLKEQGLSLGEIFYVWHLRKVYFSDEELIKYNITRETADSIINTIKSFMKAIVNQTKQLNQIVDDFPEEARTYRYINDNEEKNIKRNLR